MNREFRYWGESVHDTDSETSDSEEDNVNRNQPGPAVKITKIAIEIQCGLNRIRQENPESCDIALIVGEHAILAHKIVLSSCSPYFNAMFTKSFTERDRKEVKLNDLDSDVVKIVIDYMYTGDLPYDINNSPRILLMARFLQIDLVEKLCADYLIGQISTTNCLKLVQWAGINCVKSVCDVLIKFIAVNFNQLYTQPDFLYIEVDELKRIILEKQVRYFPADLLFTALVRWIYCDKESRLKYLNSLLSSINSSHITKDLLLSTTLAKYLSEHNLSVWISKNEPINLDDLTNWDFIVCRRTGHFKSKLYKPNSEATVDIKCMPKDYFDGNYVSYGGSVYHSGGCSPRRPVTNETFCYNIYKNKWTPFVPMKQSRAYHRSYILNGKLYICGGSDGQIAFKSTECLDLVSGEQLLLPDMLYPREEMGITAHNNAIYVIGGRNRGICQYYSGEFYDPRVGKWELLKSTANQLAISSCAAISYSIYCVNGKANALERYDVRNNEWTNIITQYKRFPCDLFEMKNDLFGVFKDHAAQYEHITGKWKMLNQFGYHHKHLTALPIYLAPHDNYRDSS